MHLNISKDIQELSKQVADWMVDHIQQTLKSQDQYTIALSGGSTPKKLYQLLATDAYKNKIDWLRMHVFWGDERFVPFNDDRNNAKMAFDELLDHVPVRRAQIHIIRTDIEPEVSAREYEMVLHQYFDNNKKSFDLVLLGLGDNAHTLSLFPGYEIIHEKKRWVRSVFLKELNMHRITLTAPVVNIAGRVAFLVSGQDKAGALVHVISGSSVPDLYPAQLIKPVHEELYWFVDEAAASRLNK